MDIANSRVASRLKKGDTDWLTAQLLELQFLHLKILLNIFGNRKEAENLVKFLGLDFIKKFAFTVSQGAVTAVCTEH